MKFHEFFAWSGVTVQCNRLAVNVVHCDTGVIHVTSGLL